MLFPILLNETGLPQLINGNGRKCRGIIYAIMDQPEEIRELDIEPQDPASHYEAGSIVQEFQAQSAC